VHRVAEELRAVFTPPYEDLERQAKHDPGDCVQCDAERLLVAEASLCACGHGEAGKCPCECPIHSPGDKDYLDGLNYWHLRCTCGQDDPVVETSHGDDLARLIDTVPAGGVVLYMFGLDDDPVVSAAIRRAVERGAKASPLSLRLVRIRCFIVWLLFRLAIKVEVEAAVEYARRVTVATADVGDEINVQKT